MLRRKLIIIFTLALTLGLSLPTQAHAYTFDQNNIIDDSVFNNFGSMNSAQIDSFLNGFANSCISANSGFQAIDPIGYNPSTGFQYGGFVTAGQVIADAAQAYNVNPQVLITTLEKEQSLVIGRNNFSGYCNNGDQHKYAAAVGYGCPDSGTTYSYNGLSLYRRNGVTVSSTGTTCVNSASKAGFTQQVIRAAWLLKFGQQRSKGNVSWAVEKGNWDNSDDPQTCYGGPTMQGTFAVCPSSAATFHDGYYTIDGTSVHINSGATAGLYWYTPHFSGNQSFFNLFTGWFGSTKSVTLPGCTEATNTTRSCIWVLTKASNGVNYYTSSVDVRQALVDSGDYSYVGKQFFGNVIPLSGNVPVYRLLDPNGGSFITTGQAEYNSLVSAGWSGQGVDFYADPGNSNSGYPVYRLYSPTTHAHQWTIDPAARDQMLAQGYSDEGVAFTSISSVHQEVAPPAGKLLVYRFYIPSTHEHFWTTGVDERDRMIMAGYGYEGVSWQSSQDSSLQPLYRLYAPAIKEHLYTTGANERDTLAARYGWVYEGVSQYVSTTPTGTPVYRLYAPSLGVHQLTPDAHERSVLLSSGGWVDEGITFYQP